MEKELIKSITTTIEPHLYQSGFYKLDANGERQYDQIVRLPKELVIPEDIADLDQTLMCMMDSEPCVRVSHVSKDGLLLVDGVVTCQWNKMHSDTLKFVEQSIKSMYQ